MKRTKEELIALRHGYLPYEEAEKVQKELIAIYKKEYIPKHTKSEYFDLIKDWDVDKVEERHEQDLNYPDMVYECFSVVSQHVYGITKEHCYDQIWDDVVAKKKRIKEYRKLPSLSELVASDTVIEKGVMYKTKEKDDKHDDSCTSYDGESILEMRELGLDEYNKRKMEEQSAWLWGSLSEKDKEYLREQLRKFII
jgi:hypothetical protein